MYLNRKLILQNVNSVIFTSLFNNRRMKYPVEIISQICIFIRMPELKFKSITVSSNRQVNSAIIVHSVRFVSN